MNLELKISAEDITRFYKGEYGREFLIKISDTPGKIDKRGVYHPNTFTTPLWLVQNGSDGLRANLPLALGEIFNAFQNAGESLAGVLRALTSAAGIGYMTEQQVPELDGLAQQHWGHLSTFTAAHNRLAVYQEPDTKPLQELRRGIVALVATANTLYDPRTSMEFIAQINESAVPNPDYLASLCAAALKPTKTL